MVNPGGTGFMAWTVDTLAELGTKCTWTLSSSGVVKLIGEGRNRKFRPHFGQERQKSGLP